MKVKLSRFPKMVMMQYIRAKLLGYPEDVAKAIGYAQALKYAIFKNTGGRRNSRRKSVSNNQTQTNKSITVQKDNINKTFRITFTPDNKWPTISNKTITNKDFVEYFKSFNKDIVDKLYNWALDRVSKYDKRDLEVETRFFNNVWKNHRDEQIVE